MHCLYREDVGLYYTHFGLIQPPYKITPDSGAFFCGADRGGIIMPDYPNKPRPIFARKLGTLLLCAFINACATGNPPEMSQGHLKPSHHRESNIPTTTELPVLTRPKVAPQQEIYTVVVNEVPVKELLFSIARDAKINVDIYPGINGKVTLNAVEQTLPQILNRISKQVDLRYYIDGPNLVVSPDTPYWRIYPVNYVNISRESTSVVAVATQIATTGGSVSGSSSSGGGNKSQTTVKNVSNNQFWTLLTENIEAIISVGMKDDSSDPEPKTAPANTATADTTNAATASQEPLEARTTAETTMVVANPATGVINVRATQRQHEHVQVFLDLVMANAQRQVLIEITIVEVELSNHYQAGVDWSRLSGNNGSDGNGPSIISSLIGTNMATGPVFSFGYQNIDSGMGNVSAMLKMLETFGDVKVLSSPKIMALNNQTALLKVVDESVYFTVTEAITQTVNQPLVRTFTSKVHTVPVGLIMSVIPQINENGYVTLNIRPTISRITSFKEDPVPKLTGSNFENLVPEIQIREMETLLQVADGQTIVMGGLMQNKIDNSNSSVPGLSALPIVGGLFSYRSEKLTKTELVLFLKPTVIKNAEMNHILKPYDHLLPDGPTLGNVTHNPIQAPAMRSAGTGPLGLNTEGRE